MKRFYHLLVQKLLFVGSEVRVEEPYNNSISHVWLLDPLLGAANQSTISNQQEEWSKILNLLTSNFILMLFVVVEATTIMYYIIPASKGWLLSVLSSARGYIFWSVAVLYYLQRDIFLVLHISNLYELWL